MFTTCIVWLYYTRLEFEKQKTRLNIQLEYSRNLLKKKLNKINTLKETIQKGTEDIDNLKKVINNGGLKCLVIEGMTSFIVLLKCYGGGGLRNTRSKIGIASWVSGCWSGLGGGAGCHRQHVLTVVIDG